MEFVRAPKLEPPADFQKTHDLWILLGPHNVHKLYPHEDLSVLSFSLPQYIMIHIAIRNVSFLDATILYSRKSSVERPRDHTLEAFSLCLDTLVLLDNHIYLGFEYFFRSAPHRS